MSYRKCNPQILLKLTAAFLKMQEPSKGSYHVPASWQFVSEALEFENPAECDAEIERISDDCRQADNNDRASHECHALRRRQNDALPAVEFACSSTECNTNSTGAAVNDSSGNAKPSAH